MKTAGKNALIVCLLAAFSTLPTPSLLLFHAGCVEPHARLSASLFQDGLADVPVDFPLPHSHCRPRSGNGHDAGNCLLCQTLLQSLSGGPPGAAQPAPAPARAGMRARGAATASPAAQGRRAFLSRAPPAVF